MVSYLKDGEGIVWCVAWDHSGTRMLSCGQDKTIRIWSFTEDSILALTDKLCGAHSKTIRCACFSPDGKRLAAASFDGTISIWADRGNEWNCVANLEGHENEVKSVSWSPDGRLIASCGRDKTVWIWESSQDDDDFECLAVLADHNQDVKQVKWHPTDQILASASYDESIRLWTSDPMEDDWFATACLNGHMSTVWAVDFDVFGNYMASVGEDDSVVIWKRTYGPNRLPIKFEPVQRIWNAHRRPVYTVSWYHGGQQWDEFDEEEQTGWPEYMYVASGSADKTIAVWRARRIPKDVDEDKYPTYKLGDFEVAAKADPAHQAEINCVAWHPKRPVLASCDDSGEIRLWAFNTL